MNNGDGGVWGCGGMADFGYGSDGHNRFLFLLFSFSHFLAYGIGNSHDFFLGGGGGGCT